MARFSENFLRIGFLFAAWFALAGSNAVARGTDTLYITGGLFRTVDTTLLPAKCLSYDSSYAQNPPVIRQKLGEALDLWVINLDTISHTLTFGESGSQMSLLPKGADHVSLNSSQEMAMLISPALKNGELVSVGGALGISAAVFFSHHLDAKSWQLREFSTAFSKVLATGQLPDFSEYFPDYYCINGKSFPEVKADSTILLNGRVGDTMWVWVWNAGIGAHSIHFHGFHQWAAAYSIAGLKNSVKDSWPIWRNGWMLLYIVPDKPGLYPVHDHNLVAISGGGLYPNGMMMLMNIAP